MLREALIPLTIGGHRCLNALGVLVQIEEYMQYRMVWYGCLH